ncbi:hypothetical protein [Microcoleus vaginatus]|uniref:hypothetical protein n=1 Tax=Microcoleus vaginatus TaxID=119532 RepID=UPI00403F2023
MEALALSHSFVAYESPESELQLKSLDELGLKIPNSAWVGVAGMAVALSVSGCCWRSASKLLLPLRQEKPSRQLQLRQSCHEWRPTEYPPPSR